MVSKPGWLADSVARHDGYYSLKGEKLKGEILTAEQVAEWNGEAANVDAAPEPEVLLEAPVTTDDFESKIRRAHV